MAILDGTTDETGSDSTTDTTTEETSTTDDDDPGLVARLAEKARTLSDLVEPFATLLTAVVQAATVATLVRQA